MLEYAVDTSSVLDWDLAETPFAILDFETTGLNASVDRVIEYAIVHTGAGEHPTLAAHSLAFTDHTIDPRASAKNGITNEMLQGHPDFPAQLGKIAEALEGRVLVGYNASFDLRFLRAELRRYGFAFETAHVCAMELRQLLYSERRCTLTNACQEAGIALDGAHEAGNDALATALLTTRYVRVAEHLGLCRFRDFGRVGRAGFLKSFSEPTFRIRHATRADFDDSRRTPASVSPSMVECQQLDAEAQTAVGELESILTVAVADSHSLDWDALKKPLEYGATRPREPEYTPPAKPDPDLKPRSEDRPTRDDERYSPSVNAIDEILWWRQDRKNKRAEEKFKNDVESFRSSVERWKRLVAEYKEDLEASRLEYKVARAQYERRMEEYVAEQREHRRDAIDHNARIEALRQSYSAGDEAAVNTYARRILWTSSLPSDFPNSIDTEFDSRRQLLLIDRALPTLDLMPTVKGFKYLKTKDEVKPQPMSETARKKLYDSVVFQLMLRTAYEVLDGDRLDHIAEVAINGRIEGYDPATGHPAQLCIARLRVAETKLRELDLAHVDPPVCFKSLGGYTKKRPAAAEPIDPLVLAD